SCAVPLNQGLPRAGLLQAAPAHSRFVPVCLSLLWGGGIQSPAPVSRPSSRTRPGPFHRVRRAPPACCLVLSGWLSKIGLKPTGYTDIIRPTGYNDKSSWLLFFGFFLR